MRANLWRDHGKPEEGTQGTDQLSGFSMFYWITVRRNGEFIFGNGLTINCLPSMKWLADFAGSVVRKAWGAQYGLGPGKLGYNTGDGCLISSRLSARAASPSGRHIRIHFHSSSTPHKKMTVRFHRWKRRPFRKKVKSKMRFCHFIPIL